MRESFGNLIGTGLEFSCLSASHFAQVFRCIMGGTLSKFRAEL